MSSTNKSVKDKDLKNGCFDVLITLDDIIVTFFVSLYCSERRLLVFHFCAKTVNSIRSRMYQGFWLVTLEAVTIKINYQFWLDDLWRDVTGGDTCGSHLGSYTGFCKTLGFFRHQNVRNTSYSAEYVAFSVSVLCDVLKTKRSLCL